MAARWTILLAVSAPLVLAACERQAQQTAQAEAPGPAAAAPTAPPAPWFICDALNAPTVLVVSRPDAAARVTILTVDKADLHPPAASLYDLGPEEAEAGNVRRSLSRYGAEVGYIRSVDPTTLDKPLEATTPPVLGVKLDEADLSCRWMARTRLFGVVARRTVLVTEADDGPLLRTFDFKNERAGSRTAPDGAQRSSTPTLRIVAGKLEGGRFTFANAGYGHVVDATGIAVTQNGQPTSNEPFIAVQLADR